MIPVIAYQCEYCGAVKRFKGTMINHEKCCLKNPNAINCLKCTHSINGKCEVLNKKCSKAVSAHCDSYDKIKE